MSLQAYQKAAQRVENPRQAEYRLFGQVTRALMEASQADATDFRKRIDALDWNRRLWAVLATDCAAPNNALPIPMRAQIISLSLWINKHSSAVMRGDEPWDPLIEVNRMMMNGLGAGIAPEPEPIEKADKAA